MNSHHPQPDQPSPRRLARHAIAALRRAGVDRPIRYDPEAFALHLAGEQEPRVLCLRHLYEQYLTLPTRQRRWLVESHLLRQIEIPQIMLRFEAARPHLRVHLCHRASAERDALRQQLEGILAVPCRPLAMHLGCSVSLDLPDELAWASAVNLADWGVSFDEALHVGEQNLLQLSQAPWHTPRPGLHISPWQDGWDASRLVLRELIAQLPVEGRHVAALPNANTLIVTGDRDEAGLAELARLAEAAWMQPAKLCARPFILEDGQWQPWLPPPGHRLQDPFQRLRVLDDVAQYTRVAEPLADLYEQHDSDLFVSACSLRTIPHSDSLYTCCVWNDSELLPALLPRTDRVRFTTGELLFDEVEVGTADWAQVEAASGELMRPMGLYPERYEVRQFPSPQQLEAMGLEKV